MAREGRKNEPWKGVWVVMRSALTRRRVVVALTAVVVLAAASGAFAYFTGSGSGVGTATVGSGGAWKVTAAAPTGGPIYPGGSSEAISYTVTNTGSGSQELQATTAALETTTYNGATVVEQSGAPVAGCLASWFTVTNSGPASQDLASQATSGTGSVAVSLSDSGTNQDACEGVSPTLNISAS
jgi:hypothetical protein